MNIGEAKGYLGKNCAVTYLDQRGTEVTRDLHIHDVTYVPLYGTYIVGDLEDVNLDRVTRISAIDN